MTITLFCIVLDRMSTKCSKNFKLSVKPNFGAIEYVKNKFKDDVELWRDRYHMIKLFFDISDFVAQTSTLLYLVERGKVCIFV